MGKILPLTFYCRPTLEVAPELLGKFLVCGNRQALITEVEAYDGPEDLASHARLGRRTARTEVMYQAGGVWYVYFTYGLHWLLNIVTGEKDYPSAVLIRGTKEVSGPARLTKYLGIDKKFNGQLATKQTGLYIVEPPNVQSLALNIITAPRIGVDYAGPVWSQKPYRFILE